MPSNTTSKLEDILNDLPEPVSLYITRLHLRSAAMSDGIRQMVEKLTQALLSIEDEDRRDEFHGILAAVLVDTVADTLAQEALAAVEDEKRLTTTMKNHE